MLEDVGCSSLRADEVSLAVDVIVGSVKFLVVIQDIVVILFGQKIKVLLIEPFKTHIRVLKSPGKPFSARV